MKIAPKSFLVLIFCLILLSGCRFRADESESQETSPKIETPAERSRDSSQHINSDDPALPEVRIPKETKEKRGADLDTLRPIKA